MLGEALCDEPGDVTLEACIRVRWGSLRKYLIRISGNLDMSIISPVFFSSDFR